MFRLYIRTFLETSLQLCSGRSCTQPVGYRALLLLLVLLAPIVITLADVIAIISRL